MNSRFILVQYKGKRKGKLSFPISLHVFVELFDSFKELLTITKAVFPENNKAINSLNISVAKNTIEAIVQILQQLTRTKGLTLVEVELREIYIKVSIV